MLALLYFDCNTTNIILTRIVKALNVIKPLKKIKLPLMSINGKHIMIGYLSAMITIF